MPDFDSPHWFQKEQSCVKHGVPQLPCPACLAEEDPDVTVRLNAEDQHQLDWDPDITPLDLLPAAHPFLRDRLIT